MALGKNQEKLLSIYIYRGVKYFDKSGNGKAQSTESGAL
jgi:hypothetical protein